MKKSDLLIDTNGYVLGLLEKILDANIEIKGVENIPEDNPKIFVANHFTRSEAMLVPYAMYNLTGKQVGVIADDSLFKTYFGNFLSKLGAMSKSDPTRNNHIIGDLVTGCKDWMIFPEGVMVKSKDIEKIDEHFCVKVDGTCKRVYTGATFFALYSQLLRQNYFNYKIKNFKKFQRKYFVNECGDIKKEETMIVPINITYTKLRNGNNFIVDMASKIAGELGENYKEELEIEGNIILNSKMTIQILEPISTKDVIENTFTKERDLTKIINPIRYEITHNFMNKIYESLTINFDHVFILTLFLYPKKEIDIKHFKRLIYLTIQKIKENDFYYDDELDDELIYLISYEKFEQFEDVLQLAIRDKIIYVENETYLIDKKMLLNSYTHHTIRLKNILKVILNEVQIHSTLVEIVKNLVSKEEEIINYDLLLLLQEEERSEFLKAHAIFEGNEDIKPKAIGESKYFTTTNNDTCIINLHGFSSAPKEVEELSLYLNSKGFNVHAPRLAGHGTSPEDLKYTTWIDWYRSVSRAITIATLKYEKVFIVGFSTGGLLALLSTKKCFQEFAGIICINAALHLNDIRMKTLLPAISVWNDLVKAFNEDSLAKEYIENNAENPDINYDKYYVESIEQLSLLMAKTKKNLKKIHSPILIIQGNDDPVVNPSSAYEIFESISSSNKQIQMVEASNHVIVKGENTKELYESIFKFITLLK